MQLSKKIPSITFHKADNVPKGWGKEVCIINHDGLNMNFPSGYSGKLLVYDKIGAISSFHSHGSKWETFFVLGGKFLFRYYNLDNADLFEKVLEKGDIVDIPTGNPHQLECLQEGIIVEFASHDQPWDNYRIGKGDSQKNEKL